MDRTTHVCRFATAFVLALAISSAAVADPGISPDEGLISFWSFDNTIADTGGLYFNYTGSIDDDLTPGDGFARYVPGVVGQALAIGDEAGDAGWLDAADSEDVELPATYTIECWIYPTELSDGWQRLVLRWGAAGFSYHFAIRNNGGFVNGVSLYHQEEGGGQPNANGGTVVLGEWQHVAGVADGESLRVYLNGVEVGTVPYDGTITTGTGEGLGIADQFGGLSSIRFNGYVDELAIWNLPLTPEELLSHYEAGPDGYGLELICAEEPDGVSIDGPTQALAGGSVELTANIVGVDAAGTAQYDWRVVSGDAIVEPTTEATATVSLNAPDTVVVRVSVGDGVCSDDAAATHSISALPAGDPGESPPSGLLSYWSFDGFTRDVAELFSNDSGETLDELTPQLGSARFVQGIVGQALALGVEDGDALYLNAPDSPDVDVGGEYTFEAWIYPTRLDETWQRLLLRWGGAGQSYHFALRLVGGAWRVSTIHHQAGDPFETWLAADGGEVVANEWQHIAGVADGTDLITYLNGEEVARTPYDGTITQGSGVDLGVGDMAVGTGLRYNGLLDELAMWNVALEPDEILSHYEAGPAGYGLDGGDQQPRFRRGDVDDTGDLRLTDAVRILGFLFTGGEPPGCVDAADADDSGDVRLTDAIVILQFLFLGGPEPGAPFPDCGVDPTPNEAGDLGCESAPACGTGF